MRIVILGGGPCGLGAAWRLRELGHEEWVLFEKRDDWGGLASSIQDREGFWWDLGGHVLFSHYGYFDQVMDTVLGKEEDWVYHEREAWIWMQDRFVPYPLQNNIHRLPKEVFWECLEGLVDVKERGQRGELDHFGDWIEASFGRGLAKWFMRPYNYKVWAYPVEQLDWSWVGDRVAPVDIRRILRNAVFETDDISWGPNSRFRFPIYGGTGAIWRAISEHLPQDKLHLNREVTEVSADKHIISFKDGSEEPYDVLLTTLPLTSLLRRLDLKTFISANNELKYSSAHIVGLAIKGSPPEDLATKCWMYFPEDNCPFYRVTVFSNYSPNNVPDIGLHWSLLCEVSESPVKPVERNRIVEDVIQGVLNTGLVLNRSDVLHTWYHFIEKAYPTPSLGRNEHLFPALQHLHGLGIYSRGRFGGWRYEVGNMDHSFMQGVELVNHVLKSEEELTLWNPQFVNNRNQAGKSR